ncbi:TetR/AcrR family transcriptional regulator [Endozoicomonas euniceicola]|uniref:TetR/AcrR family transcriptional regulator n=1 Tax=Endozoicomonas euniceicola TaxID=1234143 RepID=A0ABY6GP73_9GAMM|nr:TetR/AcrR family transcriptional regulator [Endozoicomonas euniceicola]UYM14556.1 TetR/AcrR family transcriptional regulator [Endozoicomonas euniceicola]
MGRHSTFDKETVLKSALALFWSRGFTATSLRQLEEVTELHPGSLYHHFKNKEGLYLNVLKYYLEHDMHTRINRYLTGDSPLDGIRRFLTTSYRHHQEEHYRNCCFLACSSVELHLLPQEARNLVNQGVTDIQSAFEKQLSQLADKGYRLPKDSSETARQLACLFLGLQLFARIKPNQHQLDTMVKTSLQQILMPVDH